MTAPETSLSFTCQECGMRNRTAAVLHTYVDCLIWKSKAGTATKIERDELYRYARQGDPVRHPEAAR